MSTVVKAAWVSALCLLAMGAAVRAQTPTFSLWIIEVNGAPCASCPTQNLPHTEVMPGDRITVEVKVEGWDDNPAQGRCDGHPSVGQNGNCTNIGVACPGQHCINSGQSCTTPVHCGGAPCVPNVCQPHPRAAGYTAGLLLSSFQTGAQGSLDFALIPCSPPSCSDPGSTNCACNHGYASAAECTCVTPGTCQPNGYCRYQDSAAFIAKGEPEFIFSHRATLLNVVGITHPVVDFTSALYSPLVDGVVDSGQRALLGTFLLDSSDDAMGEFTLNFFEVPNATLLVDANFFTLMPASYQNAAVTFPCLQENCFDDNPCTIDRCDPDGVTCRHDPVVCPVGQTCIAGICRKYHIAIPWGR